MLFRWDSELLQAYRTGDIIVEADSVDEARIVARAFFDAHHPAPAYDEDWEKEDHENKKNLFEQDIAGEPLTVSSRCIFISGSE